MRDTTDVLNGIERSVEMTGRIVAGVKTHQWSAATPCTEWTVRDVLNHVVGGMRIFAAELTGRPPEASHEADWLGSDPVVAYAAAAELDLAAWRDPASLTSTVTISLGKLPARFAAVIHLVEVLVHGVDLAVATEQLQLVDQGLCAGVLNLLVEMGGVDPYRAPGVFGPEVLTTPQAPAHQQLSDYLGRRLQDLPTATPEAVR